MCSIKLTIILKQKFPIGGNRPFGPPLRDRIDIAALLRLLHVGENRERASVITIPQLPSTVRARYPRNARALRNNNN
jgi:hypothetical protein